MPDPVLISPFTIEQLSHYLNAVVAVLPVEARIEASGDRQTSDVCAVFEKREKDFKWTPLKVIILRELSEAMLEDEYGAYVASTAFVICSSMLNQSKEVWPHVVIETRQHAPQVRFFGARLRTLTGPCELDSEVIVKVKNPKLTGRNYVRKHWLRNGMNPEFWRVPV
jgi:hypothetical protein